MKSNTSKWLASSRRFKVGLILAFLSVKAFSLAASSEPRIPSPVGFIEGSGLSETIRAMGIAGQPASAKLVGVYYPTNTLAEILNNGFSSPSPFCKALLKGHYRSVSDAKKAFQTLVSNAKKESDKPFDPNSPAVKRIFKSYESAARNVDPSVSVKGKGISFLGTIIEKESVFATSALLNIGWSDGQSQVDMPFAVAVAWIRFGDTQAEFGVLYPFRDATSVSSANAKLLEWIGEIEKRNPK